MSEIVPTSSLKRGMIALAQLKQAFVQETKSNTKSARLQAYKNDGKSLTPQQKENMSASLVTFSRHLAQVDISEQRKLTPSELEGLMQEYVALEQAELIAKARRERIKAMTHQHVALEVEESGQDPELVGGTIEVGDRKFCKEGGGTEEPTINLGILKNRLSASELDQFVLTRVIPAQTIEELDEDALESFLINNPDKMEVVRESLVEGKKKPFRFGVRTIKRDDQSP